MTVGEVKTYLTIFGGMGANYIILNYNNQFKKLVKL